MVEMMILSIKTLGISAEALGFEDEGESKFEKWLREKFGKGIFDVIMFISVLLAVALSLALFIMLPVTVTGGIEKLLNNVLNLNIELGVWKNLIEGVVKIMIFIAYLLLTSLMKDIRRTFEYHGAEHKSVFCYESGEELTTDNVKKFSRFHPRCGTSFLFVIIIISILVSALPFVPQQSGWQRILVKFSLLPLVVGLGFEFIMFAGKHDNWFIRLLSAPGLLMQRITTKEPDDAQIEVAIYALKSAIPEEFPDFAQQLNDSETSDTQSDTDTEQPAETSDTPSGTDTEQPAETSDTPSDTDTEQPAETSDTPSDTGTGAKK